jgi:hypothetical protein
MLLGVRGERPLQRVGLTREVVDVDRRRDRLLVREVLVQRRRLHAELVREAPHRQVVPVTLLDQTTCTLDDLGGAWRSSRRRQGTEV